MKNSVSLAALCISLGLALPVAAQTPQGQQFDGQQMAQQQFNQQQQFGQQQMPGQQQQLTEQRVRNFFNQAQNVLQQTARTQDPEALRRYLVEYMEPNAEITSISELYLRDRHVATTVSQATDETVTEALGYAATALQGRKLVSDYNIQINIRDIEISPSGNTARVRMVIEEEGTLVGPLAQRVAGRIGQARERIGELRQQFQENQGGQWGQGSGQQMGQLGQRFQQRWGQGGQGGGMGMGGGAAGGGAMSSQQGIRFETEANCTSEVVLDQNQLRIGNTFCRGTTNLGS